MTFLYLPFTFYKSIQLAFELDLFLFATDNFLMTNNCLSNEATWMPPYAICEEIFEICSQFSNMSAENNKQPYKLFHSFCIFYYLFIYLFIGARRGLWVVFLQMSHTVQSIYLSSKYLKILAGYKCF
jgi:hypothetical protein